MNAINLDPSLQILNRDTVTPYLGRPWKNETLYHRLISIYRSEAASILENMNDSVKTRDIKSLHSLAHKLKGNSGVIGAERVQWLSDAVFQASGRGTAIKPQLILDMESELSIFLLEVDAFLDEKSTSSPEEN